MRPKTLALLLLRELQEELDGAGFVDVKVFLQVRDSAIAVLPDHLAVKWRIRNSFAPEHFRQKGVLQFYGTRMFEAEYLKALGLTADIACLLAASFPAASIACKFSRRAERLDA